MRERPTWDSVGLTGLSEAELEEVSDGGGGEADGAVAALLRPLDERLRAGGEGQLGQPGDVHQALGAGGQSHGVRALQPISEPVRTRTRLKAELRLAL